MDRDEKRPKRTGAGPKTVHSRRDRTSHQRDGEPSAPSSSVARPSRHGRLEAQRDFLGRLNAALEPLAAPRQWSETDVALAEATADRARAERGRANAEGALRASEARFSTLADLVPDFLWLAGPDGIPVWQNARWTQYVGEAYARGAHRWTDAIHPNDRERWMNSYASAVREGQPFAQELRLCAADGSYRWFLVRAEPQRDDRRRIIGWFGVATDIHSQRMALEEAEWLASQHAAERDRLRRQLAAAEESERRRLARELHDSLGQHVTALLIGLATVRQRLGNAAQGDAQLDQLEELTRTMARDARSLALELRPPELDDVGLESALASYAEQWSARTGIEADLSVTEADDAQAMAPEVATALCRIVQEALTNVAKHSSASHVSVVLGRPDGSVLLVVEDDGAGFDVDTTLERSRSERRLGLDGMRERAALVGGTIEVESSPGAGTTIYVRIPRDGPPPSENPWPAGSFVKLHAAVGARAAAALDTAHALRRTREGLLRTMRELIAEARERNARIRAASSSRERL